MNNSKPAQVVLVPKLKADFYKKKKITKLYTPWLWQHQTEIPQQTKVLHTEHFHTRAQISRPLCCFGYSSLKIMELKQYNP